MFHRLQIPVLCCILFFTGCEVEKVEFYEVLLVDEKLSSSDIERLFRIADIMRDGRLPQMAPHFLPEPQWDRDRPATVVTLANEELARQRDMLGLSVLAESVRGNAHLDHALRKEGISYEQYAALVFSTGLTMHRIYLDPERNLKTYVTHGREKLRELKRREESFASLDRDAQIETLDLATWITRVNRAEQLAKVPTENVNLVRTFETRLREILPQQFLNDPLLGLNDPLIDHGVPFRERASTGFDSDIRWSKSDDQAVVNGASSTEDS